MTSSLAEGFDRFQDNALKTVLLLLGVWILINVLFVVIVIPPRKPRKQSPAQSGTLPIDRPGYPLEEQEQLRLHHLVISIALGLSFSLTPPLIEAVESTKRWWGNRNK
jgi:hypothetical protein